MTGFSHPADRQRATTRAALIERDKAVIEHQAAREQTLKARREWLTSPDIATEAFERYRGACERLQQASEAASAAQKAYDEARAEETP